MQPADSCTLLGFECDLGVAAKQLLEPMLTAVDELYVTVCLDAFPANIAPGVSTPSALGISIEFVIHMLRWLAQSKSVFHYNWPTNIVNFVTALYIHNCSKNSQRIIDVFDLFVLHRYCEHSLC